MKRLLKPDIGALEGELLEMRSGRLHQDAGRLQVGVNAHLT